MHSDYNSSNDNFGDGGAKDILDKLRQALRSDGDFPVRARVVSELRALVNDSNTSVEDVTELILREPSLGTRVLHLVNSAFYQRAQPIMTVSQAVVQLGMKTLSDLCAGLILMQKFIPNAQRGGIFAESIEKSILTSLITGSLTSDCTEDGIAERGYLAGTFFNLGYLLLAFYFPHVYEAAANRAKARGQKTSQSITAILGISPIDLSLTIVDALEIPRYYRDVIVEAHQSSSEENKSGSNTTLASSVRTAAHLAETIVASTCKEQIEQLISEFDDVSEFPRSKIIDIVSNISEDFTQHCQLIELDFLTLPDYLENFSLNPAPIEDSQSQEEEESCQTLSTYTDEIKQAIDNGEPASSVITLAMEALAFGLGYDRVLLLLADNDNSVLSGRMALGKGINFDPKNIRRNLKDPNIAYAPDIAAFQSGTSQIFGEPLFEDGWPFAAIPIGAPGKCVGTIYADFLAEEEGAPLDCGAQAAISVLADLLDQAVTANDL